MIDICLNVIQVGIILNILLIVFVSIALLVTVLNIKSNNIYEYNRIIAYSKTLGKVSNWQTVANVLIPFYGFLIYYKVIQILFIDEYQKEKLEYVKSKANTYRQSSKTRTDNYHTNADYSHSSSDCCSSSSGSDCCNSND